MPQDNEGELTRAGWLALGFGCLTALAMVLGCLVFVAWMAFS